MHPKVHSAYATSLNSLGLEKPFGFLRFLTDRRHFRQPKGSSVVEGLNEIFPEGDRMLRLLTAANEWVGSEPVYAFPKTMFELLVNKIGVASRPPDLRGHIRESSASSVS